MEKQHSSSFPAWAIFSFCKGYFPKFEQRQCCSNFGKSIYMHLEGTKAGKDWMRGTGTRIKYDKHVGLNFFTACICFWLLLPWQVLTGKAGDYTPSLSWEQSSWQSRSLVGWSSCKRKMASIPEVTLMWLIFTLHPNLIGCEMGYQAAIWFRPMGTQSSCIVNSLSYWQEKDFPSSEVCIKHNWSVSFWGQLEINCCPAGNKISQRKRLEMFFLNKG